MRSGLVDTLHLGRGALHIHMSEPSGRLEAEWPLTASSISVGHLALIIATAHAYPGRDYTQMFPSGDC